MIAPPPVFDRVPDAPPLLETAGVLDLPTIDVQRHCTAVRLREERRRRSERLHREIERRLWAPIVEPAPKPAPVRVPWATWGETGRAVLVGAALGLVMSACVVLGSWLG